MKKSGITMVSIIMYVVIFFALVAITTGTSMAMNSNALKDKGNIYVNEAEIKLKNNLLNSFNNSTSIEKIANKIVFSNNDVYEYDSTNLILYKNGGILLQNVIEFTFNNTNSAQDGVKTVTVQAKIKKYNQEKIVDFFAQKGD